MKKLEAYAVAHRLEVTSQIPPVVRLMLTGRAIQFAGRCVQIEVQEAFDPDGTCDLENEQVAVAFDLDGKSVSPPKKLYRVTVEEVPWPEGGVAI